MDSYRLVAALIAFSARFRRNPRPKGQGVVTNRACQAEDHSKITVRVTLVIYPLKREKRPHSDDFAFFLLVIGKPQKALYGSLSSSRAFSSAASAPPTTMNWSNFPERVAALLGLGVWVETYTKTGSYAPKELSTKATIWPYAVCA